MKVLVGLHVFETDECGRHVKDCGYVEQKFVKTWGKLKGSVQSVKCTTFISPGVPLILYWSPTANGWKNRLAKHALYVMTKD